MIDRINLILRAKNITARQFAEEIGIQPSGMSHILGGRNNPSLDFVAKVLRRYPEIDANWLLLGRGEMYADHQSVAEPAIHPMSEPEPPQESPIAEPTLFADEREEVPEPAAGKVEEYQATYMAIPPEEHLQTSRRSERQLERILFIYSDNTFVEYRPQE